MSRAGPTSGAAGAGVATLPVTRPSQAPERQARAVARAAMRGENNLARRLTPAIAARSDRSGGIALPAPLLAEAERLFGAGLTNVRLHTDAPAARFARLHGATALTTGAHIHFAAGAYSPAAPAGRELLFHEIAHVLQQTGRRRADGRLAATALSGPGPAQRQDEPQASDASAQQEKIDWAIRQRQDRILAEAQTKHAKFRDVAAAAGVEIWRGISFGALVEAHRPAGADEAYATFCDEVATDLGFADASEWDSTDWPELDEGDITAFETDTVDDYIADERFKALFGSNGAGYGFLYDCLKKLERFEAARILLGRAPRLKTLHWHGGMHLAVDTNDGAVIAGPLVAEGSEAAGLLAALARRSNRAAFVPGLGLEPLKVKTPDGEKSLADWFNALVVQMTTEHTSVGENELVFAVYAPIFWADREIEEVIGLYVNATAEAPVRGRVDPPARLQLARDFLVFGGALMDFEGEKHGHVWSLVDRRIGTELKASGERGTAYWRTVIGLARLRFADKGITDHDPVGQGIAQSLRSQANTFFAIEKGAEPELPAPGPYAQRVAAWRKALQADVDALDKALLARRREIDAARRKEKLGPESDVASDHLAEFYGVLLNGLSSSIGAGLAAYSSTEDARATDVLDVEDVRGAHRLRMAAALLRVAQAVSWTGLAGEATAWLMSRDRTASHIYLLSDWEPSSAADSDYARISDEIGDTIRGWPVTGRSLSLIFLLFETQARAAALTGLLAEPPASDSGEQRPLHREVDRRVADLPLPRRWEVKDFALALDPTMTSEAAAVAVAANAPTNAGDETEEAPAPGGTTGMVSPDRRPPPVGLGTLIVNHPKTRRLEASLRSTAPDVGLAVPAYDTLGGPVSPLPMEGRLPIFLWQIPSLKDVVGIVRFSRTINQGICENQDPPLSLDAEEARTWLASLDEDQWFGEFRNAFGDRLDATTGFGLELDVDQRLTEERRRYRKLLRQAAVRERQALVERNGARLDESQLEVRVVAPKKAMADIVGFVGGIFPKAQLDLDKSPVLAPPLRPLAELHRAIALLQLAEKIAPGIRRAFADYNTALIAGYLAIIPPAIETIDRVLAGTGEESQALIAEALAADDPDVAELMKQRPLLGELLLSLRQQRIQYQVKMGFRGEIAQEKSDLESFREAHPTATKIIEATYPGRLGIRVSGAAEADPGFVNGVEHGVGLAEGMEFGPYTLVEVRNPFTYLPSFRGDAGGDAKHPAYSRGRALIGYMEPAKALSLANLALEPDGQKTLDEASYADNQLLLRVQKEGGEVRDINAGDTAFLDEFSNAVNIGSMVAALEKSAEVVQFVMDLTTDVVALLFGGVGEVGKASAEVLAIVGSEEFQTLADNFQKDPTKIVDEVIAAVEEKILDPNILLRYLLFPSGGLLKELLALAKGSGAPKKPTPGKKKGTFGKVIDALLDLGKHVAGAFKVLEERFQAPVAGLRGAIVSHPRIRWGLDIVGTYGPMIAAFIGMVAKAVDEHPDLAKALEGLVSGDSESGEGVSVNQLFEHIFGEKGVLDQEFGQVMETLATIELPKVIVPLETLLGAIVDLILRLAKRNAKVKIANMVATVTGIKDDYVKDLAEQITKAGGDPNRLWAEWILKDLSPQFTEFRDESVDGLYKVIDGVLGQLRKGLGALLDEDTPAETFKYEGERSAVTVTPVEGDYAAAMFDGDALEPLWTGGTVLAGSAGAPLDPAIRASAEARFGHDFRHVRVHAGREGEAAAAPVRALALTSGSHVYVHPKVSMGSDPGREVLDHELTHVLQQAGPRPLGEPHEAQPKRGAVRRGLTVDREAEGEARRTAKRVRHRQGGDPVPVSRKGEEEGPAPAFDLQLGFDITRLISSHRDTSAAARDIDKQAAVHKAKADPIHKTALAVWHTHIIAGALNDKDKGFAAPFGAQQKNILAHLGSHRTAIEKAIPVILEETWLTVKKKKGADGKPPKKGETVHEFRPGPFSRLLEGYVFAKTGVAMEIDVDISGDKTDPTIKAVKARVHFLNLGGVPFDGPLWKELIWKSTLDDSQKRELAVRFAILDPQPGIWESGSYALTAAFIKDSRERSQKRTPPKLLDKTGYLRTDGKDRGGLRLGTHGELTGGASVGSKRESHHTTQYLLPQYFHNIRKQKPFREGIQYPGVARIGSFTNGPVDTITGRKSIQARNTFGTGRGDPMPAIFIAAETHRQGRLHVQRESKWSNDDELGGSVTQGYAIDNKFRDKLPPYLSRLELANQTQLQNAIGNTRSSDQVARDIEGAAQATYRWMYSEEMGPALREALPRNELAYYRGLAARDQANLMPDGKLRDTHDLTASELTAAVAKAEARNKAVMTSFGWVL